MYKSRRRSKGGEGGRVEEKAADVDEGMQEVWRKMGGAGTGGHPKGPVDGPPVGSGDDFTRDEKLQIYAARAAKAEAALVNERQGRAAEVQAAVVQEQNRAALARGAEEAARLEHERVQAAGQQPPAGPPGKEDEDQGEVFGQGAEARGRSRSANRSPGTPSRAAVALEASMAANAAARRKAEGK